MRVALRTAPGADTIRRSISRDSYRRDLVNGISTTFNDTDVDSLSYSYDALSRPTSRNEDTFAYNERGEVVFSRRDAEIDGKYFSDCANKAKKFNALYEQYKAKTKSHSLKFDQPGWNQGGQYLLHPLDTSTFKWE